MAIDQASRNVSSPEAASPEQPTLHAVAAGRDLPEPPVDTLPPPQVFRGEASPLIDRSDRGGNIGRLLLMGLFLLGIVGMFVVLPPEWAQPVTILVLASLSVIGVFFLLALAIGFIQLSSASRSDEFARSFIDGLGHGALVTDWEGRIVYANRAYGDLTGAETARSVATVERVFSRYDDASEIVYRMNQGVRSAQADTQEFRTPGDIGAPLTTSGGSARWYRLAVRPMAHKAYKEPLIVWELADITSERQAQERSFLDLQHAIGYLDHAPAGFFSADETGALVYINATLADWLGVDLATFQPRQLTLRDIVLDEGMVLLESVDLQATEGRSAALDLDLKRTNGQRLAVRLHHQVLAAPDGSPGTTRTLVLNRSGGEAADEELRAAQVRFTRFFNNSPIAIASLSADGAILQSNVPFRRLFAGRLTEAAASSGGPDIDLLATAERRERLRTALFDALRGAADIDPIDVTLPAEGEEEDERTLRYFLSAVTDGADGGEERAIVYAIDLTEQKALERQMAQGQKMQAVGQLAGGIAHDFNNVLTAIIGFSDLLLTTHRPSDPSFPDIMNIKNSANRAASLVRQLLAFSRRQTLRPQMLSLPDVLSDLRILLVRLVGSNVSLEISHGHDLWPVRADLGQFEQVIVNLCVNARDAINEKGARGGGSEDGRIRVVTSNVTAQEQAVSHFYKEMPCADYVLVEVSDTGVGMTPEIMQKVFEPFFSTKEVGKGTGLGLATVYGIVKQSGGFVYADSVPGEGTTFKVYLPRHVPEEKAVEVTEEAGARPDRVRDLAGSATILFVEDEDSVRAFGSRALEQRGYTVHAAEDGAEALEIFDDLHEEIDLIVSDVVMPEMDGPTLLARVRERGSDVPFIFASGYAEDAFEKSLAGIDPSSFGFIPKPYELKRLATAVKEGLEGKLPGFSTSQD